MTLFTHSIPARRAVVAATLATGLLASLALAASAGAYVKPVGVSVGRPSWPLPASPTPCSSSLVFRYTGAEQTCVVPGWATKVEIVAVGGRGGSGAPGCDGFPSNAGNGGWGAEEISPVVSVSPGEQLYVEVGGNGGDGSHTCGLAGVGSAGAGGWNGGGAGVLPPSKVGSGGGGGASDVRSVSCATLCAQGAGFGTFFSLASRLVVAGGGGGGASGGGAGDCGGCTTAGGNGGFAGGDGGTATISGTSGLAGVGGAAGTSSSGGQGGMTDPYCGSPGDNAGPCTWGSSGHLGVGGAGGDDQLGGAYVDGLFIEGYGGGGGGGGYYGGGGGDGGEVSLENTIGAGGGGGGGSSYGPAGSVSLPSPAAAYVEIIPLGGGQTHPAAG